jgi:hypothetical protein
MILAAPFSDIQTSVLESPWTWRQFTDCTGASGKAGRTFAIEFQDVYSDESSPLPGWAAMFLFELVIGLLFAGALLALWADRLSVPYPALLALVGALVALIPGAPAVMLNPGLALALFVAPTLLDAAYDASPRDLRNNLVSVDGIAPPA